MRWPGHHSGPLSLFTSPETTGPQIFACWLPQPPDSEGQLPNPYLRLQATLASPVPRISESPALPLPLAASEHHVSLPNYFS